MEQHDNVRIRFWSQSAPEAITETSPKTLGCRTFEEAAATVKRWAYNSCVENGWDLEAVLAEDCRVTVEVFSDGQWRAKFDEWAYAADICRIAEKQGLTGHPQRPFRVSVGDNWDMYDEVDGPCMPQATFETYDEALAEAREIVRRSVEREGFDFDRWLSFGDDAYLSCPFRKGDLDFSSSEYARELCEAHRRLPSSTHLDREADEAP